MRAAAAGMEVSLSILKEAKAMGCEGFKVRGSVDEKQVRAFIAKHHEKLSKPGTSLRDQKIAEEIRKLKIRNDKDDKKLVLKSEQISTGQRFATWQVEYLTQKLVKEYPSVVAGLDVPGAMAYGRRVVADICASTQEMIKTVEKQ
jgi:predicted  nucleic acid-binding Zn ribbon protein